MDAGWLLRLWVRGLLSLVGVFTAAATALAQAPAAPDKAGSTRTGQPEGSAVVVLTVQDAIGPASADYIIRGIARANRQGAELVVLQLDTPGGLDTSMRMIIQSILASPVPVATFVAPSGARAASAGTYILYASHIAAMAPSTTLGAATPVALGGGGGGEGAPGRPASAPGGERGPGDAMTQKQVNDAAALIRGLAQQRGRNADWAERAVREGVSLTASEAVQEKAVDLVAPDVAALLRAVDGRTVRLADREVRLRTAGAAFQVDTPGWRHQLLSVIANPSFALVLMMLGVYGLIFEFSAPGFGVPGVVGAICLLLGLFALQMLPVNHAGLALLFLGLALMAAEVVSPTFGVLGVGGVIAFVVGGVMLFDDEAPGMGVPWPLLLGLAALSAVIVIGGVGMALRARRRPVGTGTGQLLGSHGRIVQSEGHHGWAMVHGERWKVHADQPLAPGQPIRVTAVRGLTLSVEPDLAAPPSSTRINQGVAP